MFQGALVFNQPINYNSTTGSWNTSNVTNMNYMFYNATVFNQNISNWVVTKVTTNPPSNFSTGSALSPANNPFTIYLNLDANGVTVKYVESSIATVPTFVYANPRGTGSEWFAVVNDTSKSMIRDYAKNLSSGSGRTYFTTSGNVVPFKNIVTTLATDMSLLFFYASTFNEPIASWDTSNVTNMTHMFEGATVFNQNIGSWNTANVTNMELMFHYATAFNQPLNSWNTANVTNMGGMFHTASKFNQPLNSWNTSKVTNMSSIFQGASIFNGNITTWNTANVTTMDYMFYGAEVFNQNIRAWVVTKVTPKPPTDFSTSSALTTANSPVWT